MIWVSIPYRYKQNTPSVLGVWLKKKLSQSPIGTNKTNVLGMSDDGVDLSQSPIGTNKTKIEIPLKTNEFAGLNPL